MRKVFLSEKKMLYKELITMTEEYSKYYGESPEQIVRGYMKKLNKRKAVLIFADAAAVAVMISALHNGEEVLAFYITFIFVIIAVFGFSAVFRAKSESAFNGLMDILNKDCDPRKYQAVMELLMKKDRFQRGRMRITLECALADYYQNRSEEALERLKSVTFKSPKNVSWVRKYNIEALCRHAAGDFMGRDACVEKLEHFRLSYKPGTANRQIMDHFMMELYVCFKPLDQWGTTEKTFAEQRIVLADNRLTRMRWQLRQAEYELLYGDRGKAEQLLENWENIPAVPNIQAWIGRLKKIRERE